MKKQTNVNIHIFSGLLFTLALTIYSPVLSQAAEHAEHAVEKQTTEPKMMDKCHQMMEEKQKMTEEMKMQNRELSNQVAKMNSASKDNKVNLMATVITRIVEQRSSRDEQKAKMEKKMMEHMMQHMQMGKESMSKCPMMRGGDEKTGDGHKGH